jgi:hypothetical protein
MVTSWLRAKRLTEAARDLREARERVAFSWLRIYVTDDGCHWQFRKGCDHVASYWPASAKLQLRGEDTRVCTSVGKATHLVERHVQASLPVPLHAALREE